MRPGAIAATDLRGVFAVPPLARTMGPRSSIDFAQNDLILRHITRGGISRVIYGGNAFLYHISLAEYARLIDWLSDLSDDLWVIPSLGPDYGLAIEQAELLRRYRFPCAMVLPCSDPRDAAGLERGYREIAAAADAKLILYLKHETTFGDDREAGLDAVARLLDDGVCAGIKYAIARHDPADDPYLEGLLRRVDRDFIISGIGERPAVVHLRHWGLPGFTTGSGCLAPRLSQRLFEACADANYDEALRLRAEFLSLEDLRDAWNPAKVLHAAIQSAGIANTGPVPPLLSDLSAAQTEKVSAVAGALLERESTMDQKTAEAAQL